MTCVIFTRAALGVAPFFYENRQMHIRIVLTVHLTFSKAWSSQYLSQTLYIIPTQKAEFDKETKMQPR